MTAVTAPASDPDRARYLAWIRRALKAAVSVLGAKDRLRLACYYRRSSRSRRPDAPQGARGDRLAAPREDTAGYSGRSGTLSSRGRTLNEAQIDRCFEYALEDAGPLDLGGMLRKDSEPDRSI